MHIFLTGGSGFVGQHLITRFIADGHTVLALARSDASTPRVRADGAEPVRGDPEDLTRDRATWTPALAACGSAGRSSSMISSRALAGMAMRTRSSTRPAFASFQLCSTRLST